MHSTPAAQVQSTDNATHHTALNESHTGSDGSDPGMRMRSQGYNPGWWGENIAYNYPNLSAVMAAWLASPGHCSNIMNSHFTQAGVAQSYDDPGLAQEAQVWGLMFDRLTLADLI